MDENIAQRNQRIRLAAMTAPAVAQIIMLVALIAQHQWLFATMIGAGCLGYIATIVVNITTNHASHTAQPTASEHTLQNRVYGTTDTAGINRIANLRLPSLPLLAALGLTTDVAPWRTIARRWLQAQPTRSLAVTIGVSCTERKPAPQQSHTKATHSTSTSAQPLDVVESLMQVDLLREGPHAIVAGTTGSGKSVLLQTWCLALAAAFPPTALQFLFLDFKGGSALERLTGLPHVRGCVSDLNLKHAVRALEALEYELKRREALAAAAGVADIANMDPVPARLIVVVDEFHALTGQLPDYVDRLVRVASLGRSLGMHIIACTQNPLGQISPMMKANMSLRLCMRVQDAMQSHEMLGAAYAANISPTAPGTAFCSGGESDLRLVRVASASSSELDWLIQHVTMAARFHGCAPLDPLFTAPLPSIVTATALLDSQWSDSQYDGLVLGLADTGVTLKLALLDESVGNIAIIGRAGSGRSNVLRWLQQQMEYRQSQPEPSQTDASRQICPRICFYDDADHLLDPLNTDPEAQQFKQVLSAADTAVIFVLTSSRYLRIPDHCTTRLLFPTGERSVDLANGIPSALLSAMDPADFTTPGRGVLITSGMATLVQCALA